MAGPMGPTVNLSFSLFLWPSWGKNKLEEEPLPCYLKKTLENGTIVEDQN